MDATLAYLLSSIVMAINTPPIVAELRRLGSILLGNCSLVDDFEDEPKSTAPFAPSAYCGNQLLPESKQQDLTTSSLCPQDVCKRACCPPPPTTPLCHVFLYWKTTGRLERGQNSSSSQEELPFTHQPLRPVFPNSTLSQR